MAQLSAPAIVCAARPHGEHGVVLRALTAEAGLVAGYVRGGRSRRMRPVLLAGNLVQIDLRARTDEQLGSATAELLTSRAPLLSEPLAAAAVDWVTALTGAVLPDSQPFPALFSALSALLDAIAAAPSARGWGAALARYELLMLAELGFGLDLDECVVTGARDDLAYVSRRSGGAVSRNAAAGYEARLLALPAFLRGQGSDPALEEVLAGLAITGHFLDRDIIDVRHRALAETRARLIERLNRAVARPGNAA